MRKLSVSYFGESKRAIEKILQTERTNASLKSSTGNSPPVISEEKQRLLDLFN